MEENANVTLIEVEDSAVPFLIEAQFNELGKLEKQIKLSRDKAETAKRSADEAKEKSAGFGKKKAAIESLQGATVDLATAQVSASEAQELSFENQQKLAKITKALFDLGIRNIALNRMVVREIELRLANATEEELSDLAREEMMNVVRQLKAQEDIMLKQSELSHTVKIHGERLDEQELKAESLQESINKRESYDELQDEIINQQSEKDIEHDRLLEEGILRDHEHDAELSRQAAKDKEHDNRLNKSDAHDILQDERINECIEREKELETSLTEMEHNLHILSENVVSLTGLLSDKEDEIIDIKKRWRRLSIGLASAIILSIVALVLSIVMYL